MRYATNEVMNFSPVSLLCLLGLLILPCSARAELLAEETFPIGQGGYKVHLKVGGQNATDSQGLEGPWVGSDSSSLTVENADLTVPGGAPSPTALQVTMGFKGSRSLTRQLPTIPGNSIWLGFNLKLSSTSNQKDCQVMLGLLSDTLPTVTGTTPDAAVWSAQNGGDLLGVAVGSQSGELTVAFRDSEAVPFSQEITGVPIAAETPCFVIVHLDSEAAGGKISVWLTSTVPATQAQLGAPQWSKTDFTMPLSHLTQLGFWAARNTVGNLQAQVSLVRLATDYGDLVKP
jgi:hypothetical protein